MPSREQPSEPAEPALLNISIDDVSPHKHSSIACIDECFRLADTFPGLKFSLFVPMAYWRSVGEPVHVRTEQPLRLSENISFCAALQSLPSDMFEVCYHGWYHGIPFKSNNDEFKDISYASAKDLLERMVAEAESVVPGLFKPIFRPPAWRMSSSAIRAARDVGFAVLALATHSYAVESYGDEYEHKLDIVHATASPPADELVLLPKTAVVYHACDWLANRLNEEEMARMIDFLEQHNGRYRAAFMEEML